MKIGDTYRKESYENAINLNVNYTAQDSRFSMERKKTERIFRTPQNKACKEKSVVR